jgi:hypothetical protein
MLTNFISDKVYVVCSTHSSGEDLELFVWCENETYIEICLDFFIVLLGFTFKCRSGNTASKHRDYADQNVGGGGG